VPIKPKASQDGQGTPIKSCRSPVVAQHNPGTGFPASPGLLPSSEAQQTKAPGTLNARRKADGHASFCPSYSRGTTEEYEDP